MRLVKIAEEEGEHIHIRLGLVNLLVAVLPYFVGSRFRSACLRAAGFSIGRGSLFWGMPTLTGSGNISSRLRVGEDCQINFGCVFDLGDSVTIGRGVGIGHQVLIVTGSHQIGSKAKRAGEFTKKPVVIEDGAWIGARSIVLPGVTIGAGAVIGAGTLVSRDIPPNTLVSGEKQVSLANWR